MLVPYPTSPRASSGLLHRSLLPRHLAAASPPAVQSRVVP